ncbi:non-homologous end-joining DNA ligase [Lapillicoccus jejuensis]|uniref:Bifunctional non-homologous end joining protein LigD n=1 Tax=Lapillicoccus jejuensis TaxID=402171 RepID=A0A542DXD2_9MICO|nr:non-homologous end-joining DNA ligase [Lapillicoccus jejuensis]TQJ07750.1 bifunctional non-homologous end joining protein LigD [Lapillicoccus jejuensis]
MPEAQKVTVEVAGRRLAVSNLDKVLYPATETTKGEVLHYYAQVAPTLLRHLGRRPVTRIRWPHGVEGPSFFEKNLPSGVPSWLPRVTLSSHGRDASAHPDRDSVTYPLVLDLADLTYLVNLASLELHVHQWQVDDDGAPRPPDRLVIDLDPGTGAGLEECARVALWARPLLADMGLTRLVPVTSGSKGMQVYAALPGTHDADDIRALAQALAQEMTAAHPDLVVWKMTKSLRPGKVLLDWSQNTAAKTTVCPYSLRGKAAPYVAAPRTWDEVEQGAAGRRFEQLLMDQVLERVAEHGDLAAELFPGG